MSWIVAIVAFLLAVFVVVAFRTWRNWIAPWRRIAEVIRQVGRGERPRTFLIADAPEVQRAGVALEEIFNRQRELELESATRAAGQKAIFSALQDGLLVLDPERRIVLFNRAFEETFGINEHAIGAPLLEALREPLLDQILSEAVENDAPARREATFGGRSWQLDAAPMRHNRQQTGTVVLFHDVTELKRVDEIRRDFVANVSHELRTPLSILRGYIETLLEGETSPEERRRILGVMERHSKRLGVLLNDLLTLAKLESPQAKMEFSAVRLDESCLNTVRDWEKKFAEKDLHVIVELAPGLPSVQADASRLQEVLYNLLDNAVKYSPEHGEIRLRVEQRDNEIALSVSDHGPGISRQDLPRIFERFYRADKSRSGDDGGTGLGLAIVKHIAQLHRGRVEAESVLGKGTTIRVFLPAVTQT